MSRKNRPPDSGRDSPTEEMELFRRAMAETKPLTLDIVEPLRPRRRPKALFSRLDERQVLVESLESDIEAAESQNGDGLHYGHPSIGKKTMRRLARGGFAVQGETDLHGLTTAEAREVLHGFIEACRRRGYTCVRIVHGKGLRSGRNGPVLKRKVDLWLRRWEGILAFVSARQVDGGTGAVYVLLKK